MNRKTHSFYCSALLYVFTMNNEVRAIQMSTKTMTCKQFVEHVCLSVCLLNRNVNKEHVGYYYNYDLFI